MYIHVYRNYILAGADWSMNGFWLSIYIYSIGKSCHIFSIYIYIWYMMTYIYILGSCHHPNWRSADSNPTGVTLTSRWRCTRSGYDMVRLRTGKIHPISMGKSNFHGKTHCFLWENPRTFDWAMFNSKLLNYLRVYTNNIPIISH